MKSTTRMLRRGGSVWAAALFVFVSTGAGAVEGYVVDGSGEVVWAGDSCVRTQSWSKGEAIPECEPGMAQAEIAGLQKPQKPMEEPRQQAQAQPEAVPSRPREVTRRVSLDADTNFGFDDAQLTSEGEERLDRIAQRVKETQNPRVEIVGYADRIGPESYNQDLSQRRAEAVKDYLTGKGVPAEIIQVSARGESSPVVSCEGMSGQSLVECLRPNRRSEIEFSAFETVEAPADESMQREPESGGEDSGAME